jgi:hypothetical protein
MAQFDGIQSLDNSDLGALKAKSKKLGQGEKSNYNIFIYSELLMDSLSNSEIE